MEKTVALSSCEAEYNALADACELVRYFRSLFLELGLLEEGPTTIFVDNKSTIQVALAERTTQRSRHMAVRHHFVREMAASREIEIKWVSTDEQKANILTKALSVRKFEAERDALLNVEQ